MGIIDRNVVCILGIPFDMVDMEGTIAIIHTHVNANRKLFLSTPNLNFLITSQKDSSFRESVINSDLSIADGKPILWMAHLLGLPLPERVAGSDLIEELIVNKNDQKPLKVLFFGGQNKVAWQACENINQIKSGLDCVGYYNPGFVPVDQMSSEEIIDNINSKKPDFVIVSLGAKKGQQWIEKNIGTIHSPVISHLGAVVNFIAGNVKRSPKLLQKLGFEWIWRIKEEPALWKRYFEDARQLFLLLSFKVFPLLILNMRLGLKQFSAPYINTDIYDGILTIQLGGDIRNIITEVKMEFDDAIKRHINIRVILDDNSCVDNYLIGLLMLLKNETNKSNVSLSVESKSNLVSKLFKYNCCDYFLKY